MALRDLGTFGTVSELYGVSNASMQAPVAAQSAQLERVLTMYREAVRAVNADNGLNAFGKRQRVAALQRATIAELDTMKNKAFGGMTLAQIVEDRQRAEKQLAERLEYMPNPNGPGLVRRVPTADRLLLEARQREVRDRLLALEPAQRAHVLRMAAIENDTETLIAAKNAPRAFPVCDAETWEQVDRMHIEKHHAGELQAIRDLENLESTLTFNLNVARKAAGGDTLADAAKTAAIDAAAAAVPVQATA
jgi:hypothetical protein